jgi:outer membrane receptor for ferric coprogen and ferric-rhodotorulic acid
MYRNSDDFIEDIPTALPAQGPFRAAQLVNAVRKYKAFVVELVRRMGNGWTANVSYSWSRLEGNFDLDYAAGAVFNTSSAIQDGPGEFVEDRFRYGPLGQDRPHVFKLFTSYTPPRLGGVTLGGYLRAQSGAPWAARGRDWDNGFRRYLEPAGTRRIDPWTNVDLLAAYRIGLGARAGVKIEGRVFNLFDNQAVLNVDQNQYNDGRVRPANAAFAPCGTDYACATDLFTAAQPTTQPNPLFGTPNSYAGSRRFVLTLALDF